ncbi:GNAT family N-acetyltransferase [Alkaliphilus pronyensis]|nr:GNAT family N-acetyltransferase [Alkaliphilus pronyensis]
MYKYKTIIFDLDGTLFKTDTIFVEAINQICMARGVQTWEKGKLIELIGKPTIDICRILFGDKITNKEVEIIQNEVRSIEEKLLVQSGKLYEGVIKMLNKLKNADYTLCICTNGSDIYTNRILSNFAIKDKFSIIKSRIDGLTKSQHIIQILDETESCNAIVVGDRASDFESAEDTGCLSIGVSYGYGGDEYQYANFTAVSTINIYYIIEKINRIYYKVSNTIINTKKKEIPLIVGINGVDTSGKTVFTKDLANYLKKLGFHIQTIHLDDFHNPSEIRHKDTNPILSYIHNAFNLNCIETELLKPVISDGILDKELTLLELESNEFNIIKKYEINPDTIVLVEGVLLYREPIDKYFELRIYLDISFEEVLKRASIRDGCLMGETVIEKYRQKYIPIQKWYIEKYQPVKKSTIIIKNDNYEKPKISSNMKNLFKEKEYRIGFRTAAEEDLDDIRKLHKEDYVKEMLGVTELPDKEYLKAKNTKCYVILNGTSEIIGIIEFFSISWRNRRAELSIIIKSEYRGKGYGTEAIEKILDIGFGELGFNRIWLRVLDYNRQAIESYKKAGFIEEGVCREESFRFGKFKNQIQMSILRNEWIHRRN